MPEKTKRVRTLNIAAVGPEHDVLVALRRIIHAVDLQSKRVSKASGSTPPQILILRAINDLGEVTSGRISEEVSLSQGTVTTILDRLEHRRLIERYRSEKDRRVAHARLTKAGRQALKKAPALLHERFITKFSALDAVEQQRTIKTLETVAEMLGGGNLGAAPILDIHPPEGTQVPQCVAYPRDTIY